MILGSPAGVELEMRVRPFREQSVVRVARQFDAQIVRALGPVVAIA